MPKSKPRLHTGGCQCGAVRYALHADPDGASICHCRMCQKATGGYFGAAAGVTKANLTWTRGTPASFRSSELIERDFCAKCGTPLTFRYLDRDRVSAGTYDALLSIVMVLSRSDSHAAGMRIVLAKDRPVSNSSAIRPPARTTT